MSKYSTIAGTVTKSEAFSKLIHHLNEAADQAAIISHLHNTEDSAMDKLLAKGWLGVHEMLLRARTQITKAAMTSFN
jgi:hypothetical protein